MRRTRTALAATAVAALLLSGCGGEDTAADETPAPSTAAGTTAEEPSQEASEDSGEKPRPQGPFADLTFEGDTASPNGERVELGVGETLTLRIHADAPGELHVHSTPEQEIAFPEGRSERDLTIDQPGVVDVEDHHTGRVLLQLEVR